MAKMLGKQFVFMFMFMFMTLLFVSTTHARESPFGAYTNFRKVARKDTVDERKENEAFTTNSENQQQPLFYQQTENYNPHGFSFPTQSPPPPTPVVPSTFNPYSQVPPLPPTTPLTVQEQYQQPNYGSAYQQQQQQQYFNNHYKNFQANSAAKEEEEEENEAKPKQSTTYDNSNDNNPFVFNDDAALNAYLNGVSKEEDQTKAETKKSYIDAEELEKQQQQQYFNNHYNKNFQANSEAAAEEEEENEAKPKQSTTYDNSNNNNPFVFKDDAALNAYLNGVSKEEDQTKADTKKSYIDAEELEKQQQQEYFNNHYNKNFQANSEAAAEEEEENEAKPKQSTSTYDNSNNNPFVFKDDAALNAYLNGVSKEEDHTKADTKKSYIDAEELEKIFAADDDDDVAEKEEEENEANKTYKKDNNYAQQGMSDTRFMENGMYNFNTRTNQFTSQSHPYNQHTTKTKADAWMNYYRAAQKTARVGDPLSRTKYNTNSHSNRYPQSTAAQANTENHEQDIPNLFVNDP